LAICRQLACRFPGSCNRFWAGGTSALRSARRRRCEYNLDARQDINLAGFPDLLAEPGESKIKRSLFFARHDGGGLNRNHNHEMKDIFKGAATRASCGLGPLRNFYVALLDKGMKPEMARLTLARKIAAIALTLWKKEDAEQLKPQAA
jgi:hypothetical protein